LPIYLNNPTVSVVLTVYNRAELLKRSVGSLLRQSFEDWELIAVDDGSEDNSYKILNKYHCENENIKIIRQSNLKLPRSRNTGIYASKGKYITFLDSDDEYKPDHLLERVNFLNSHPEIDLVHGGVEVVGNEYVRDKDNLQRFIHISKCKIGATFFGRREVFLTLKGFRNIPYSEDSDFWERAEKVFHTSKVTFNTYIYHRDDPDSITNTISRNMETIN
jgi:glycosyltransferase involved in cell wall biosynthesis